ncbi:MAG: NUDIX hydrolase [Acidimicrobiales bacterium]|nr:NUDIX hydrolase [Acidimicrobiales bacterium]
MTGSTPVRRSLFRAFGLLPRPFRRTLIRALRPSWTAGAVAVLQRDDGRFLFVKPVYREGWTLPGGLVDRGEDPGTAVIREMGEEVGATVRLVGEPMVIIDSTYRRLETAYRVELDGAVDPDSLVVTTPELDGIAWHGADDLPDLEPETSFLLDLVHRADEGDSRVRVWRDRNR